ncbi:MAG: SEC-C metal-binding domain-containing protein [Planctomycetota bacterium]
MRRRQVLSGEAPRPVARAALEGAGRNDDCPCGSGKKVQEVPRPLSQRASNMRGTVRNDRPTRRIT